MPSKFLKEFNKKHMPEAKIYSKEMFYELLMEIDKIQKTKSKTL